MRLNKGKLIFENGLSFEHFLKACGDDVTFLYVGVGDRAFWKDPNCVFRTDERTKLRGVPTLVKWGTAKKLDDNCHKKDFVEMLLEDD